MILRRVWIDIPETCAGPLASDLRSLAAGLHTGEGAWPRGNFALPVPIYRNMSVLQLQGLRASLYLRGPSSDSAGLVEAIMRFCEVNLWNIERCMVKLWGARRAPAVTVLTAACLLEYGLIAQDARPINTVLKLRDTRLFPASQRTSPHSGKVLALAAVIDDIATERLDSWRHS